MNIWGHSLLQRWIHSSYRYDTDTFASFGISFPVWKVRWEQSSYRSYNITWTVVQCCVGFGSRRIKALCFCLMLTNEISVLSSQTPRTISPQLFCHFLKLKQRSILTLRKTFETLLTRKIKFLKPLSIVASIFFPLLSWIFTQNKTCLH